ncbi:MAG: carbon starvation CstA family protein [Bacillota bacterium]|uniref:Carbon starvation protein A n=1 Tax=Virgibacillus salarius TaxID=447199 RepID=A0A941DSL0_9BACI|nr:MULTISPECIES: carbon starvation CstA family protein [Bacillaceae]NAZ07343.1 carbon starvation protein A [Agaribacter marinus]MBR7794621.1 carbon starvation protein A [Virgibacillus salarius]MCC2250913.1 carbon starvation protein A [Virgibacillus sp. AGTR]MDY7044757.1 carbon starvation CstA family protein [Virgibacillus sp. M23]QRZ16363.1 carbon starvation protein A [Virgibacillus sp. AGTR]
MVTFVASILLLLIGYFVYGRVVEQIFGINDQRPTPAYANQDGFDYMPMSWWKAILIQLLNIAGTGPIFGAVMGALYGPVAFIWIVIGCIFAGAVHDYMSGMLSLRQGGAQFPSLVGKYLGKYARAFITLLSILLMILVAAAFTAAPAQLLSQISPLNFLTSILIVFAYFLLATVLPINKIIGKIYPLFGAILIFMAISIGVGIFFFDYTVPNLTLTNLHPNELPIWPLLMVTISCGAISGFHSTQSPILARTLKKESEGRKVFYGAMIGEGIIALVWAAAGMAFYNGTNGLQTALGSGGPAGVVNEISIATLGTFGGILAVLGVMILPITTGDTALRSSRMMLADLLRQLSNKQVLGKRSLILLVIPVAIPAFLLSLIDYSFLWRYVGWSNQVVATFMLWTGAMYLLKHQKFHWICSIPALFMTGVVSTYIFYAPEGFHLEYRLSMVIGTVIWAVVFIWFIYQLVKSKTANKEKRLTNTYVG